ncbi:HK97-gp10 family putative phage morphogenesis protein [Streptomyces ovatisporus]|uniref:HK97-gp10 family putative phage morphogenesis protein n=1 Tax=Streptomyces ovatisporus TaxID=1128682 RepID=A0ABV9A638_9ACTN
MARTRISGMRDILRRIRGLPTLADLARRDAIDTWADELKATAKRLAPVDTGKLRKQIESRVNYTSGNAWVGVWGSAREYAYYVEKGTSSMPDQPYLGPAAQIHRRTGERALAREINRRMGGR